MIIRPEMFAALRLQRTGLKKVQDAEIAQRYADSLREVLETVRPGLPPNCNRVLDIGGGLGGMSLLLGRHYGGAPELTVLDASKVSDECHYGYGDGGEFYADLQHARRFLVDNGVAPEKIKTVDIRRQDFPSGHFDLVVSFVSWGFHYPVDVYAERVRRALSKGGTLIIEVRKNTPAEKEVLQFGEPQVLADLPKRKMLAFNTADEQ